MPPTKPEPTQKTTPERRASEQFRHVLLSPEVRRELLKIQKGRARLATKKPIYAVRNRASGRLYRLLTWSERCTYRAIDEMAVDGVRGLMSPAPCQKCDFCIEEKGLDSNKFKIMTVPANKLPAMVEELLAEAPTGVAPAPAPEPPVKKKPRALDLQEAPTPVKLDRWGQEPELPEIEVAIVPPPSRARTPGPQDKFLYPPPAFTEWGRSYAHYAVGLMHGGTHQTDNAVEAAFRQGHEDEFAQAIQEGVSAAMRTGLVQHVAPPPASARPYEGRAELYPVPTPSRTEGTLSERVVDDHPLYGEGARDSTLAAPYRQDWRWAESRPANNSFLPLAQLDPRFLPRQYIRRMTGTLVPERYRVERATSVFPSAHEWRPQTADISPSVNLLLLDQAGHPNWGMWWPRVGDVGEHLGTIWTGTRFAYLLRFGGVGAEHYACFSADGIERIPREGERLEHQWESTYDSKIARTAQFCIHCGRERRPDTEALDCSRRTRR